MYRGTELVARHRRSFEPYDVVTEPSHHAGLWRTSWDYKPPADVPSPLVALGRSLDQALRIAIEVDTLAQMYLQALQLGEPPLLSAEQMAAVHQQFRSLLYGAAAD